MSKDTYYFSHDGNARNDENILMLRAEYGWAGYGIYWALVEMMFESAETSLYHKKIKGLSVSYNIDITLLTDVINTCIEEGLFVTDGETFWSESLRRRKQKFQDSKQKRSEAGKKGMAKRWGNKENDNNDIAGYNNAITEPGGAITENNKGKERKGKESKEKEIKEKDIKINEEPPAIIRNENYNPAQSLIDNNIINAMGITKTLLDDINDIYDNYGFTEPDAVIEEGIKVAVRGNGKTWRFIYRRLDLWRKLGVRTVEDARAAEEQKASYSSSTKGGTSNGADNKEFASDWEKARLERQNRPANF